ncbi:MAG: dipeptidase E [Myxococcota bacterium]|jgi:dipeptidase E
MQKTILALGGGGWAMEPENPLLDDFLLSLSDTPSPRIMLLPTASGDSRELIARFEAAFADRAQPSHLSLFRRTEPIEALLDQDIVFVSGGNTANMLAIWRLHGVGRVLRRCWEQGVVLAGLSAGSLCWFEGGVTDSFSIDLGPLPDGLGLLPGSHCPHYDGEALRRPVYTELLRSAALPPGVAVDDGAALLYRGTTLVEAVSSRPGARAWQVDADGHHAPIPVRFLG